MIYLFLPLIQTEFNNYIYKQEQYWDVHGVMGKRDSSKGTPRETYDINLDNTGYVDGGDTTFHMGHYYTGLRLLEKHGYDVSNFFNSNIENQERVMSSLYAPWTWGIYRRHPDSKNWYSDADRMSRDQQKSIVSSESLNPNKNSIKRVLSLIGRHFLFRLGLFDAKTKKNGASISCHMAGNCDYSFKFPTLTGPTIWASYIRFLINKHKAFYVLYPLLILFDFEILINQYVKTTIDKNDNDVLNHINYMIWFHYTAPTPQTWFILNKLASKKDLTNRLLSYYDDGRCPWMNYIIWKELIKLYVKSE